MFDASKSKLFPQIMAAAAAFFGLDAETATEAEVHNAFGGLEPLKAQIDTAKTDAIAANTAELTELKEKVGTFQTQLDELKTQVTQKDTRIAELQTELSTVQTKSAADLKAAKEQHDSEIKTLSGQVAALRAGKPLENPASEQGLPGKATETTTTVEVLESKSSELQDLYKKKRAA